MHINYYKIENVVTKKNIFLLKYIIIEIIVIFKNYLSIYFLHEYLLIIILVIQFIIHIQFQQWKYVC